MNKITEKVTTFPFDTALIILPIVISIIALTVSIIVAWSNRKSLQVEISRNIEIIEDDSVFFGNLKDEFISYTGAMLLRVEVVNPSPKDIAFFDLRAFHPDDNINIDLLTRRSVPPEIRNAMIWQSLEHPIYGTRLTELTIPDSNYGVFKSNSFTRLHILVFPNPQASQLLFSFKVAMRARFRKDPFAVTGRKQFKMYGVSYDISSWEPSTTQSQTQEPTPT